MGNWSSVASPEGHLLRHKQRLEDMIESRFELTGQLATSDVIGYREVSELRAISSVYQRNAALLDLIAKKPQTVYEQFLKALELTGQKHVANFIRHDGVRDLKTVGEDWPLELSVLRRICRNLLFLEDKLDAEGGLVESLVAHDVLTHQQSVYVKESRQSQKTAELINIITRRSFAHLRLFIQCLYSNGQSHVAKVLEEGGVVICVEVELQLPNNCELTVFAAQTDIIFRVHQQCQEKPDERLRIKAFAVLADHDIEVLDAKPGSVRLYLWCRSAEALASHRRLLDSGELKAVVETWFTDILDSRVQVTLAERRQQHYDDQSLSRDRSPSTELWSKITKTQSEVHQQTLESTLYGNLYSLKPVDVTRQSSVTDKASHNNDRGRAVTVVNSSLRFSQDVPAVSDSHDRSSKVGSQPSSGSRGCGVVRSTRRDKGFLNFS